MGSTGHLSVIGVGFAAEQSMVVAQSIVVVVEVDGMRRWRADVYGGEEGDLADMRMRVRVRVRMRVSVVMVGKGMGMGTGPVMKVRKIGPRQCSRMRYKTTASTAAARFFHALSSLTHRVIIACDCRGHKQRANVANDMGHSLLP